MRAGIALRVCNRQASIRQAFTWIADELGRQYSLGYYPSTPGKDGERRQIKVNVTEADLVVKARASYIYSEKGRTVHAGHTAE